MVLTSPRWLWKAGTAKVNRRRRPLWRFAVSEKCGHTVIKGDRVRICNEPASHKGWHSDHDGAAWPKESEDMSKTLDDLGAKLRLSMYGESRPSTAEELDALVRFAFGDTIETRFMVMMKRLFASFQELEDLATYAHELAFQRDEALRLAGELVGYALNEVSETKEQVIEGRLAALEIEAGLLCREGRCLDCCRCDDLEDV